MFLLSSPVVRGSTRKRKIIQQAHCKLCVIQLQIFGLVRIFVPQKISKKLLGDARSIFQVPLDSAKDNLIIWTLFVKHFD